MDHVHLGVAPHGAGWSVKHNGGHVGHVASRAEALQIARGLAEWLSGQGRRVELEEAPADVSRSSGRAR